MQSISKLILPTPTYSLPDPTKKSHARKQPEGHIPRPRNAFILFRCDFVRQKKIPESVEADHRNISRIVGRIWRQMTALQKDPWVRMADAEKVNHLKSHPGYRFTRGSSAGKRKAKSAKEVIRAQKGERVSLSSDEVLLALDRAASCPPGELHTPAANLEGSNAYGNPMKIRDDLERRPSRIPVYQSTPHDLKDDSKSSLFSEIVNQQCYAEALKDSQNLTTSPRSHEFPPNQDSKIDLTEDKDSESAFCGPRISAMRYPIPDITVPPDWESYSPAGVCQWPQESDSFHSRLTDVSCTLFDYV